jgi:hypothetical protein
VGKKYGRLVVNRLYFFFKSYFQFKWIHCKFKHNYENFLWIKQRLYFLYPKSLCTHAELHAHIFVLIAITKMCSILLKQIRFFLRGSIKFLGSELKFRVDQVSENRTFFFCMTLFANCVLIWLRNTTYWLIKVLHEEKVACAFFYLILFHSFFFFGGGGVMPYQQTKTK